jgi:3'-phosphoadenosine 5'-phosphosulfate sulfotransferase (PAPS reductase)/FAD synthetase/ferredoxin
MFRVVWDKDINGVLLTTNGNGDALNVSPRPVYHEELTLLGFDKKFNWKYPESNEPLLWALDRRYYYKGELVAEAKGGNIFDDPKIEITEAGKELKLKPINIQKVVEKNQKLLFLLEQEAIEFIEQTYRTYSLKQIRSKAKANEEIDWALLAEMHEKNTKIKHVVVKQDCDSFDIMPLDLAKENNKTVYLNTKIDQFIVSFSGGKDSQVTLDLVSRVIPPDDFMVIYSDTGMEIPPSLEIWEKTKKYYTANYPQLKFHLAKNHKNIIDNWGEFGAPSRLNRWCCTVAKTAPLYKLLKDIKGNGKQPNVLVYEGVRAEESYTREKYARIGKGVKHNNVINARPIFDWSATEIYLYLFSRNLPFNSGYRKGLSRVGCTICPFSSEWSEHIVKKLYSNNIDKFIDIIIYQTDTIGIENKEKKINYIKEGNWKKRAGGKLNDSNISRIDLIQFKPEFKVILTNPKEKITEWLKVLGYINFNYANDIISGEILIDKIPVLVNITTIKHDENIKQIIVFKNISENPILLSKIKKVLYKTTYCTHCEACEIECPTGALQVEPKVSIDSNKCIRCGRCYEINEKGCLLAKTIYISEGNIKNSSNMKSSGIDKYSTFGLREKWLSQYFQNIENYFETGHNDLGTKMIPALTHWLRDAELLNRIDKKSSEIAKLLIEVYQHKPNFIWEIIWINLAYNSIITNWYVGNVLYNRSYSKNELLAMLQNEYPNYSAGTLKNPLSALLNTFDESSLGNVLKLSQLQKKGNAIDAIIRKPYENIDSFSVAYSLYRYANSKNRYNLTVSELYAAEQKQGIYKEFGVSKERFQNILRTLQENKYGIVKVDLVMGLDNISLREDLTYTEVLKLLLEK